MLHAKKILHIGDLERRKFLAGHSNRQCSDAEVPSHWSKIGFSMKLYSQKRGGVRTWFATFAVAQLFLLASGSAAASETFNAERYAGKVVILDFWASWCVPCRRSFPWLNAMHKKYADDGLVIIGVNLDMERADAARFLEEYPAEFAILYDENQELARQFEVVAMPSSYVIGRDGKILARHMGFKVKQQDEYESIIVDALRKPENENE